MNFFVFHFWIRKATCYHMRQNNFRTILGRFPNALETVIQCRERIKIKTKIQIGELSFVHYKSSQTSNYNRRFWDGWGRWLVFFFFIYHLKYFILLGKLFKTLFCCLFQVSFITLSCGAFPKYYEWVHGTWI